MTDQNQQQNNNGGADWTAGFDDGARAIVQAKNWKSPLDAVRAYDGAQKLVGADKVPLPPLKDGKRDWSQAGDLFKAMGRPEKAVVGEGGYVFKAPEGKEFTAADQATHARIAETAHKLGLAPWQLGGMQEAIGLMAEENAKAEDTRVTTETAEAEKVLRGALGQAYDAQMDLANRAFAKVGGEKLVEAWKKNGLGRTPEMIRAFAELGAFWQESGALPGGKPVPGHDLTPDRARAEILQKKTDPEFQKAFLDKNNPKHEDAMATMMRLQAAAQGIEVKT